MLTAAVRRLLPYYRPYRTNVALGLAFVVLSSAGASLVPWLVGMAVDALGSTDPLRQAARPATAMVVVAVVAGALRYWMRELINGVSRHIEHDLRNDLFRHLTRLDAGFYGQTRTGELMARLTNDLSAVRMAVGPAIMYLTNTVVGGMFALGFMLRIDAGLAVLALLPMALLPAVIIRLGKAIHDRFEAVQEQFGALTTAAQENLAGVRVVRAYRQEDPEIARFSHLSQDYVAKNMSLARLYGVMHPTTGLLAGLGAVVVLGAGGALVLRDVISVGAFVAFGFYLAMLTWPMIALGWVVNLFQRGAASWARLAGVLDAVPAVSSAPGRRTLASERVGRSIEFRGVSFHYPSPPGEPIRWVLQDVSFAVPAGATLGIVGATGSGKSAVMDLIPRLYDPQIGEILIDDVPIRQLDLEALRGAIGYVPQETFLFGDTIRANLTYGGASPADAEWGAAVAALDQTIRRFPGGFETILGERGINLSGGQKQRAALARALARRPSIVLLDDSLSAVDTDTEAAILQSLRTALAGRTAIIASHRASAIRNADWIIVLDEGRVVEQGRHDDLIGRGTRYWSLLSRQALEESLETDTETLADQSS